MLRPNNHKQENKIDSILHRNRTIQNGLEKIKDQSSSIILAFNMLK